MYTLSKTYTFVYIFDDEMYNIESDYMYHCIDNIMVH